MKRTKWSTKQVSAKIKKAESTLTDDDIMPFGKYHESGTKMANVPAWYLLNLYESGRCFGEIKNYIQDNLEVLKQEKTKHSDFRHNRDNPDNW